MRRGLVTLCLAAVAALAVWAGLASAAGNQPSSSKDPDPGLFLGSGSGDSGEGVTENAPAPEEPADDDEPSSSAPAPASDGDNGPGTNSPDEPKLDKPKAGHPKPAAPKAAAPKAALPKASVSPKVVIPKQPPPPPTVCRNFYAASLPSRTVKDAEGNCWHQEPSVNLLLDERTDKLVYHVGDLVIFTEKVVNLDSSEAPEVHLQKAIPPGMEILGRPDDVSWDYTDPNSGNHYTTLCHIEGGVGAQLVDCMFPMINSGEAWTVTIIVRADRPGLYRSNTAPEGADLLSDPHRWNLAFAGTDKRADPEETANYGLSSVLVLGLVWDGKAYRTAQQLVPWLQAHHMTWKQFKRRHPGAVHLLTGR